MDNMFKHIAFISNHPAPYRDPFLNLIVKREDIKVDVFSLFDEDTAHAFWNITKPQYNNIVLVHKPRPPKWKITWMLLKKFVFSSYDCVCWPGFLLSYLTICMFVQALLKKEYVICADTVSQKPISKFAFWVKKFIVRRAKFVFVPGLASKKYFMETFGLSEDKVCLGTYALDGNAIEKEVLSRREQMAQLRAKYNIPMGSPVFLMIANMIKTRHYPITTEAFSKVCKKHPDARFVIVGRGPDLEVMEQKSKEFPQLIVLPGVSFDEMLNLYAFSNIYVHGGIEPASTALVIGAISNLPLLSSNAVGCSWDCLQHKQSGYCVPNYLSVEDWEKGFLYFLENLSASKEYGIKARALSRSLDVEKIISEFIGKFK